MGQKPAHRASWLRRPAPTPAPARIGGVSAAAVALIVLTQTLLIPAGDAARAVAATAGAAGATGAARTNGTGGTGGSAEGSGGAARQGRGEPTGLLETADGRRLRLALVGDSYLNGKGAPERRGMGVRLARTLDARLLNFAEGGTGWADDGPDEETKSFDEHARAVLRRSPDLVVIAGGYNDHAAINKDLETYDDVAASARSLLGALGRDPEVRTVVIGPFWVSGDPPLSMLLLRDVLKAEVERAGAAWIDPIAEGWISGDRRDRTGNAAVFIRGNRIHPTPRGHRYLAQRMARAIRELG